jgi:hypothetical protein
MKNRLIDNMKELIEYGYKCYISDCSYGYIITPSDNVIYVQQNNNWQKEKRNGWILAMKYYPSQCWCFDNPIKKLTLEILQKAEQQGIKRIKEEIKNDRIKGIFHTYIESGNEIIRRKLEYTKLQIIA